MGKNCKLSHNSATANIGSITNTLLINDTGKIITVKGGITKITKNELLSLPGHYHLWDDPLPNDAIILPLIPIAKKSGVRLVAQLPTKSITDHGIKLPVKPLAAPGLDLKGTLAETVISFAQSPPNSSILFYDLANAYARIIYEDSKIFTKTTDGHFIHLRQPVQGLSLAGTLAPALMFTFFKKNIRAIRRKLSRRHPNIYLHASSYSDNLVLVTNFPKLVNNEIQSRMGIFLNHDQTHHLFKNHRALGLRWKMHNDGQNLTIRRPARIISTEKKSYFDFLLGKDRPLISISKGPINLYCDGVEVDGKATSAAVVDQEGKKLFGLTESRHGIDQLLSEAKSIRLANELRVLMKRPSLPIKTDSEILFNINNNEEARGTIEHRLVGDVDNLEWICGKENEADSYTRDENDISVFYRKRPRKWWNTTIDDDNPHVKRLYKDT